MRNQLIIIAFLLSFLIFSVTNVAGQGRHMVPMGSEKEYRVKRQPNVVSTSWAVYTDAAFTIPALPEQAELISFGEGRDNEIKVLWHIPGDYYLVVTMIADNGCVNKKAWPFSVQSPANVIASTFCLEAKPHIKWDATANGLPIDSVALTIVDLQGNILTEITNAPSSGSMLWPDNSNYKKLNQLPDPSSVNLVVTFYNIPNQQAISTRLDAPDCSNEAVIAINDTIDAWHGITTPINILFNDYDIYGHLDSGSVTIIKHTENGTITVDENGKAYYTPETCFFGVDSFIYTVANTYGLVSNQATVYINVEINPHIDTDNDGIADIDENVVGTNNLCDTDTDMNGIPNYQDPDDDGDGIPTIEEHGDQNENGIPDYLEDWKSKAVHDEAYTTVEIPVVIAVLVNDSTTMVPATLQIIENPTNGYVNVNNSGEEVKYFPDYDFMGQDSFVYIVCDHYNICDTALVVIKVDDVIAPPQVFTPNNDGYNDKYEIKGLERYSKNSFVVFNRWGNIVFEQENYTNDWDGYSNSKYKIGGKPLPVGVYYYVLKYANNRIKQGGLYLER